jgi:aminoglycoside phosphotransferase (APT) family kinase protein
MRDDKPAIPPETIPIRADEDFDHHTLAAYLHGKLPGAEQPLAIEQFGGGHANLTYLLRYGGHPGGAAGPSREMRRIPPAAGQAVGIGCESVQEYDLRRPPPAPGAAPPHDMGREYRVLSVLHRAYPPAPRALLFCDDAAIIGAPFFVMERRRGIVIRRAIPPEFGGGADPAINRRISEVLVDALADLHEVDYRAIGLETLGKPEGFLRRQIDGWAGRYERAKTRQLGVVDELVAWLQAQQPAAPPPALLHNDWRLDNMMLDAADPGRVEAVFDWDMCTLGDPLCDLGTLLASWMEPGEGLSGATAGTMPSHVPGFLSRRAAVERYGARRGVDVGTVPYYYVFGLFKIAVVLQQIYYRYHVGQTQDARFAVFDQVAEMLFGVAQSRIEQGL